MSDTAIDKGRRDELEKQVWDNLERVAECWFEIASGLKALREEHLFDGAWADYCLTQFGITHWRANQLIRMAPVGKDFQLNERAARALGDVPAGQRQKVHEIAEEETSGKVTGKSIEEAFERFKEALDAPAEPVDPNPPKIDYFDELETKVPEHVNGMFMLAHQSRFKEISTSIRRLRREVEELAARPHGAHLSLKSIQAELNAAAGAVKKARPYAMCPDCGGQTKRGCRTCNKTCVVSEAQYDRYKQVKGG